MTNLEERLEIEFENIEKTFREFPPSRTCSSLSNIEIAGVGALLHNFYSGVEKILKDIVRSKGISLPDGATWHRDLIDLAVKHHIILEGTAAGLTPYLAFRHFFVHGYVFLLDPEKLEPLLQEVDKVLNRLMSDLKKYNIPEIPS